MVRLIKRYGNRKLYDTHASAYITLDGIAALVRGGQDVRVIDNDSGADLTALIFAQVIVEEQKKKSGTALLSMPALRWILQEGEARIGEFLERVDKSREAIDNVRDMAEKGVERLVRKSGELLETPQRSLDALQKQIDTQVRRSVEAIAGHPAVKSELSRIQTSLRRLEEQLRNLRSQPAAPQSKPRKPRKRASAKKESRT